MDSHGDSTKLHHQDDAPSGEDVVVERMSVAEKDTVKSVDRQVEKTVKKKVHKWEQESTKNLVGSTKAVREAVKFTSRDLEEVMQVVQKIENNTTVVAVATGTLKDSVRREFDSKLTEVEQKMTSRWVTRIVFFFSYCSCCYHHNSQPHTDYCYSYDLFLQSNNRTSVLMFVALGVIVHRQSTHSAREEWW